MVKKRKDEAPKVIVYSVACINKKAVSFLDTINVVAVCSTLRIANALREKLLKKYPDEVFWVKPHELCENPEDFPDYMPSVGRFFKPQRNDD